MLILPIPLLVLQMPAQIETSVDILPWIYTPTKTCRDTEIDAVTDTVTDTDRYIDTVRDTDRYIGTNTNTDTDIYRHKHEYRHRQI